MESRHEGALAQAARRLDQALGRLDAQIAARASAGLSGDAFADDRARLAAELDAARSREKALERLAAEASAALGRAADEVRAALEAERRPDTTPDTAPEAELGDGSEAEV